MTRGKARHAAYLLVAMLAALVTPARAQTFQGSFNNPATGATDLASASFSIVTGSTNYLQIVLTNTSTFSVYHNPDLLSGLFFAIATSPSLTPAYAVTPAVVNPSGCVTSYVTTCSGSNVNVGHEFGYVYSAAGFSNALVTTDQYGIGAAGYSSLMPTFGSAATFGSNPPNLDGNPGLDGLGFSIVGSAYNNATSSTSLSSLPMSQTSVTFGFALPVGVSTLNISNVIFAYGTAPDGSVNAPEPATLALFAFALITVGVLRRRRA